MTDLVVVEEIQILTEIVDDQVVVDEVEVIEVLTVAEQGPPGVPGSPGPSGGTSVQRSAGATVSALRVVYELNGEVFHLDREDAAHIHLLLGVALNAGAAGTPINVQRFFDITDASWNWTPGRVYLGAAGALTQTPPAVGYHVLIGSAVSATRLTLNLQDPISM